MAKTVKKQQEKFVLTVEGETEERYFKWLETSINKETNKKQNIKIDVKKQQHPKNFGKTVNTLTVPKAYHICDVESNSQEDITNFKAVLEEMRKVKKDKQIDYVLGYSNLTFELWMILHKMDCGTRNNKNDYLTLINKCFDSKFERLEDYKKEKIFQSCLNKLTLDDVIKAIERAEKIEKTNGNNKQSTQHCSYSYYVDNPSLSVHEVVKAMLKTTGLYNKKS